jgi:hypothetical protein
MAGRVNDGTALSSDAVDAMFWALVCDDEEWLDLEFAGIVSGPAESRARARRRLGLLVDRIRPRDGRFRCRGVLRVVDAGRAAGTSGGVRRQRSPPPEALGAGVGEGVINIADV